MLQDHEIWKIYGTEYLKMTRQLLEAAGLAERIGDRKKRIGIKPNLVTASPAEFGGTTHTEVIGGIIEYLRAHGFDNLIIAEGSWVGDRTEAAFEYCGYNTLSRRYGVPLVDTQKERWHAVNAAGMELNLTDVVDQIDFLINVPVLKGHCQTRVTCALKNMKGLLPNKEKSRFHRMGLHKPIAHLNTVIRQDFIVIDHICGDLDFEEGGNPVTRNCVMAAADPVLTDSYVCYLMQYDLDEVPYIRMAEQLGCGTTDLEQAQLVLCETVPEETGTARITARTGVRGGAAGEELPRQRRILDVAYAVEEVDSCSACYGNLIGALCRLEEEGLLDRLDTPIGIGQGMQGRKGKLGVGRCTRDFEECVMGCPPSDEKIYAQLRARILGQGQPG